MNGKGHIFDSMKSFGSELADEFGPTILLR